MFHIRDISLTCTCVNRGDEIFFKKIKLYKNKLDETLSP